MLNVNPMQLTHHHGPEFHLDLENEDVVLHGSAEESAGVVLRGSVTLNCLEQTKIKSVTLKFIGMTYVNWTEGSGAHQKHYKAERKLIEKNWTFLEAKKKAHCLSQGRYKWEFEIPLPGNLPESVYSDHGQIYYRFKASCDRPTFFNNLCDKKAINITRLMLPSSLELNQAVIISNVWADKVAYDISIPSKIYSTNTSIPVSFDLTPIAPQLKVKSINCCLKEYVTCHTLDHHKTEGRIINHLRDDHLTTDDHGHWSKTELVHVPANQITFDISGELIQIKHKLKFTVALENADGHISELRAAIPLVIAPMLPEDDENALPAYEEALRSIPFTLSQQSPSLSSDSSLSLVSSSSSNNNQDYLSPEPLNWMGMDISRVPSYGTALRSTTPCYLSPSLPNYDSIIMA